MCFPKIGPPVGTTKSFERTPTADIQKDPAGFSSVNQFLVEEKIVHHIKKVIDLGSGEELIMKVFRRNSEGSVQFSRELQAVERIPPHEHILHYQEAIDDPSFPKTFMVMEHAEGGQITHVDAKTGRCDRTYPEHEAAELIRQLADGILHMHSHGVVHRDLKPENVLLDSSDNVKIADFGECAFFDEDGNDFVDGPGRSIAYSCPEGFACGEYHGMPADAWGIGVVAYCIVFGRIPFWGESHSQVMNNVLNDSLDIPCSASPDLRDFLSQIFEKDPSQRMTVAGIFSHPWITTQTESSFVPQSILSSRSVLLSQLKRRPSMGVISPRICPALSVDFEATSSPLSHAKSRNRFMALPSRC